jgi:hypothetical protein
MTTETSALQFQNTRFPPANGEQQDLSAFLIGRQADAICENPDLYPKDPRPSVLKHYFYPNLRKVVPVNRRTRQLTVKFHVEETETYVPAF